MDNQNIGESQITPQQLQQVTPDIVSPQGKQQLFQHLASATVQKDKLDFIFKGIAEKLGADFSSRVKNPKTVVQKIAQKRLQGRDYNVNNINDAYGARIVVKNEKEIPHIKKYIEKASDLGIIDIKKSEMVNTDYHKAWHIDFTTDQGTHGELQILTPQEEANSMVNHDLRSVYGEKMPPIAQKLADMQKKKVLSMNNQKASVLSKALAQIHQTTNGSGQPLPPQVNSQALASISNNQ